MEQKIYKDKVPVYIDIYPDGHGIWLDGGEIDKLRNRKLVKFVKSVKFAFSEKGF